jgi:hypothetical protein
VGHGSRWRGTMPVLLTGREPDHVTGTDLLDGPAFALCPPATSRDDESLTEWMVCQAVRAPGSKVTLAP